MVLLVETRLLHLLEMKVALEEAAAVQLDRICQVLVEVAMVERD